MNDMLNEDYLDIEAGLNELNSEQLKIFGAWLNEKPMNYTEANFLYPPRPVRSVLPGLLGFYEKKGYWAQIKKNGTCSILGIGPQGEVYTMSRHAEPHKSWSPSKESLKPLVDRANGKWRVYVVEAMDKKTKNIKDTIYIHDIIVNDGIILERTTFAERQELLQMIFPVRRKGGLGYDKITEKVWLATIIKENFKAIFDSITDPKVNEGLVLKDPNGKLKPMWREGTNTGWQVKCRYPTKNYGY